MFKNFSEAEKYIWDHIPTEGFKFQGNGGFLRSKSFLEKLGKPQNGFKSIHVAGTSGKGSTSYMASHFLHSQGLKVGLFISPHIIDVRERIQLNNQFIKKDEFVATLNKILPLITEYENTKGNDPVTFFEILAGLAFTFFKDQNVDYAVIETGMGGLLDTSNTIERDDKVCVITQIGFDHMRFLGDTIEKIASEKAGIIHKNQIVITNTQEYNSAIEVIENKAQIEQAQLNIISKYKNFDNITISSTETVFDFKFGGLHLKNFRISLLGDFRAENASLSLAAVKLLSKRDNWEINEENLRKTALQINFPARFIIKKINESQIILDGAHNEQKMDSFISSLSSIFPQQKFTFVIGFKKDKEFTKILKIIVPFAKKIIATKFETLSQDISHNSIDTQVIRSELEKMGFSNIILTENVDQAIKKINETKDNYVITGSLYLISEFYNKGFIK